MSGIVKGFCRVTAAGLYQDISTTWVVVNVFRYIIDYASWLAFAQTYTTEEKNLPFPWITMKQSSASLWAATSLDVNSVVAILKILEL
jgi:hypothetical protein